MIHIHTKIYDDQGYFRMEEDPKNSQYQLASARIQRDKLLDGSTYLKNHGYSEGDRTFKFISKRYLGRMKVDQLWYIFKNYTSVLLSCPEGFYSGSISALSTDKGKVEITFIPDIQFSSNSN
jgi:hypothetical protein